MRLSNVGSEWGAAGYFADEIGNWIVVQYYTGLMISKLGQYVLHLACGVGLFVLPAIHERACVDSQQELAAAVRPESAADAREQSTPASNHPGRNQKSKKQLSLAVLVPDVVAPRWPVHVPLAAERRERPLPVAAWRPFAPCPDDGRADQTAYLAYLAFTQTRSPALPTIARVGIPDGRIPFPAGRSFLNSITFTGPPLG